MSTESKEENIDLWSERGVAYSEIRSRLPERADRDVLLAWKWFKKWGLLREPTAQIICELTDSIRSAVRVLDRVEPEIRKQFEEHLSGAKGFKLTLDNVLELNALVVEAYVRSANACFPPLHGRN